MKLLLVRLSAVMLMLPSLKTYSCRYSTFKDVGTIVLSEGKEKYIVVNKCIGESENMVNVSVMEVFGKYIPILFEASIANLSKLEHLSIETAGIRHIENNAFYNLPVLRKLALQSNEIEKVGAETFKYLELQFLNLTANKIHLIENKAFEMKRLTNLYLTSNKLTIFRPEWFGESNLLHLELDNNLIEYIPANAFKKLKKIRGVTFANNRISYLDKSAFNGAKSLRVLVLSCNRIKSLHGELFDSVPTENYSGLNYLYLSVNRITYLPKKLLSQIQPSLRVLDIGSNPLDCTCFREIAAWGLKLRMRMVFDSKGTSPVCVTSLKNPGSCNEIVDEEIIFEYHRKHRKPTCLKEQIF